MTGGLNWNRLLSTPNRYGRYNMALIMFFRPVFPITFFLLLKHDAYLLLHTSSWIHFWIMIKYNREKRGKKQQWNVKTENTNKDRCYTAKWYAWHSTIPLQFQPPISQVNWAQSNKVICNNTCWSKMLRVTQHIYIMPSSEWEGPHFLIYVIEYDKSQNIPILSY